MQERMSEHFGVTMKERPMLVTVLAVLSLVVGVLSLVGGLAMLGVVGLTAFVPTDSGGSAMALGAFTFAMAPVSLGLGYGFWAMRPWAWAAGITVGAVMIAMAVFAIVFVGMSLVSELVNVGIGAFMIGVLVQPKNKALFAR
jgi:hypothetical protein